MKLQYNASFVRALFSFAADFLKTFPDQEGLRATFHVALLAESSLCSLRVSHRLGGCGAVSMKQLRRFGAERDLAITRLRDCLRYLVEHPPVPPVAGAPAVFSEPTSTFSEPPPVYAQAEPIRIAV